MAPSWAAFSSLLFPRCFLAPSPLATFPCKRSQGGQYLRQSPAPSLVHGIWQPRHLRWRKTWRPSPPISRRRMQHPSCCPLPSTSAQDRCTVASLRLRMSRGNDGWQGARQGNELTSRWMKCSRMGNLSRTPFQPSPSSLAFVAPLSPFFSGCSQTASLVKCHLGGPDITAPPVIFAVVETLVGRG